jgi:tRNA dimethylallyltransferase
VADYTVILGPTASGKTGLSIELATELVARGINPEIINGDSMQLYEGMDIATAKLPLEQRQRFPHHMFDVAPPENEMSVVQYQLQARSAIDNVIARGGYPILVGGSMLYLQSVIYEMEFAPTDSAIREKLEEELEKFGPGAMLAKLQDLDPESAERLEAGDARRIVRALELYQLRGRGLDEFNKTPRFWRECNLFGLSVPRDTLRRRINERVEAMWDEGLIEETKRLRGRLSTTASHAIGYQQVEKFLDGEISKREAIEQIQTSTARYAKRQMTWFKRDENIHWLEPAGALEEIISRARL